MHDTDYYKKAVAGSSLNVIFAVEYGNAELHPVCVFGCLFDRLSFHYSPPPVGLQLSITGSGQSWLWVTQKLFAGQNEWLSTVCRQRQTSRPPRN